MKLSDHIYHEDTAGVIYLGDALGVLKSMESESVQCCVTSPPYWGLRDYGTASWEGGDAECDHKPPDEAGQTTKPTSGQREHAGRFTGPTCYKCGATRIDQQLGLEKTPEEYVEKMVQIFREVRRVLKKDGTLWCNLGDSYAGSGRGRDADGVWNPGAGGSKQETNKGAIIGRNVNAKSLSKNLIDKGAIGNAWVKPPRGYKAKDLIGIPWRVAFALQADGWWLRSDIIWSKPNPMPESVTDRPTKAHEYIFLMSKSSKYYYDAEAIKEDVTGNAHAGRKDQQLSPKYQDDMSGFNQRGGTWKQSYLPDSRNKRSVWTIATQPFKDAHFAVFPEKLIEPCILAGTSERGCCPECGAAWKRVVKHSKPPEVDDSSVHPNLRGQYQKWLNENPPQTIGWKPVCKCGNDNTVPCIVLDPFIGSGTVAAVSKKHGRKFVGIDLKAEYLDMAKDRLRQEVLF